LHWEKEILKAFSKPSVLTLVFVTIINGSHAYVAILELLFAKETTLTPYPFEPYTLPLTRRNKMNRLFLYGGCMHRDISKILGVKSESEITDDENLFS
jgi:hypothetical protein